MLKNQCLGGYPGSGPAAGGCSRWPSGLPGHRRNPGMARLSRVPRPISPIDKSSSEGAALRHRSDRPAFVGRHRCPWFLALDNPSMSSATMLRTIGIVCGCRVSFPSSSLSSSRGCPPLANASPLSRSGCWGSLTALTMMRNGWLRRARFSQRRKRGEKMGPYRESQVKSRGRRS